MSATIPPPPLGLPGPHRSVRSLRVGLLLGVAAVAAIAVVGTGFYEVARLNQAHQAAARARPAPSSQQRASVLDLLAGAPAGSEIPPARRPPALRTPAVTPVSRPAPAPVPIFAPQVQPGMTEAEIAGRRAAWAAYYQQMAQLQTDRLKQAHEAMTADIDPQQTQPGEPGAGGTGAPGNPAGQQQPQPKSFWAQNASSPATDYAPYTLTDPLSPYELKAGDVITGKLLSGLDSDSPGEVIAVVTRNVLDYSTGLHILIPQGSRLVGTYSTAVAYGQTRVEVAWTRIIYPGPCSQSLDLGSMPGADQTGQAGFSDITNDHLGKVFVNALLVSLFGAGIQLSQPPSSAFQQYSPIQSAGGAIGQQMGELGQQFAQKGLNIPPTQQIRQGYAFSILLTKDIAFAHPWVRGVCDDNSIQVAQQ
jgi:type IV secretion system protein VirB10